MVLVRKVVELSVVVGAAEEWARICALAATAEGTEWGVEIVGALTTDSVTVETPTVTVTVAKGPQADSTLYHNRSAR